MKTLAFDTEHDLARIQLEVTEGVPALAPVDLGGGLFEAVASFSGGEGRPLTIYVPDELSSEDEEAVAQIVAAHEPTPLPPSPTKSDILLTLLETVEPGAEDTEILWLVLMESLRP